MILSFSVENYGCIKNRITFSFEAMADMDEAHVLNPTSRRHLPGVDKTINTVNALYGANAAGKTTLLRAFEFLSNLIMTSQGNNENSTLFVPYYDTTEPAIFQATFLKDVTEYRYEVHLKTNTHNKTFIGKELLVEASTNKPSMLINRVGQDFKGNFFKQHKTFNEIYKQSVRDNQLVLSQSHLFFEELRASFSLNHLRILNATIDYWQDGALRTSLTNRYHYYQIADYMKQFLEVDGVKKILLRYLSEADFNIVDYQIDNRNELFFIHQKQGDNITIPFDLESTGTQKFFWLLVDIVTFRFVKSSMFLLVIDEIERSLHPRLALLLIDLFKDPEKNPNHHMLWFTTHDTSFMHPSVLNGDQVWLIERDRDTDDTVLSSAADFEGFDPTTLEREYFRGAYGAVPNTEWER
jgi:uncharacterized protein